MTLTMDMNINTLSYSLTASDIQSHVYLWKLADSNELLLLYLRAI